MKAQVESRISYTELEKLEVLISILNRINACENESELRDAFSGKKVDWYKTYFIWGFGAHHMWVHEKIDGKISKKRLILVEF